MKEEDRIMLAPESVELYKKELRRLITIDRKVVIQEIKEARMQGDLSENAEYIASKERQAQIEGRIRELEYILENYQLVESATGGNEVRIGSTVEVLKLHKQEKFKFKIVGFVDADPLQNRISNKSPLAKAVLKKRVGDVVQVNAPLRHEVKILNIE